MLASFAISLLLIGVFGGVWMARGQGGGARGW